MEVRESILRRRAKQRGSNWRPTRSATSCSLVISSFVASTLDYFWKLSLKETESGGGERFDFYSLALFSDRRALPGFVPPSGYRVSAGGLQAQSFQEGPLLWIVFVSMEKRNELFYSS